MTLDDTVIYVGLVLAACALTLNGRTLLRRRTRTRVDHDASLLDAIVAQHSPASGRQRATIRASARIDPNAGRPMEDGSQLSGLEGHLRNAVLNAPARERLVADAMRATDGNRAAAIRKVLRDLHDEDKRWS